MPKTPFEILSASILDQNIYFDDYSNLKDRTKNEIHMRDCISKELQVIGALVCMV